MGIPSLSTTPQRRKRSNTLPEEDTRPNKTMKPSSEDEIMLSAADSAQVQAVAPDEPPYEAQPSEDIPRHFAPHSGDYYSDDNELCRRSEDLAALSSQYMASKGIVGRMYLFRSAIESCDWSGWNDDGEEDEPIVYGPPFWRVTFVDSPPTSWKAIHEHIRQMIIDRYKDCSRSLIGLDSTDPPIRYCCYPSEEEEEW